MVIQSLSASSILWLAATIVTAQPVPDFSLPDVNANSPRFNQTVSPRDYRLQVSGYYFADADCSYCRSQFGYLNTVATQLQASNPAVHIEILGVNWTEYTNANFLMTAGRQLPWLQPAATNTVHDLWSATERDVRILDPQNRLFAVYNLTTHSLAFLDNVTALKQLFLDAAQFVDTDGDHLLDDWELLYFGNLSPNPADDPDGDHQDNFTEYAFGTDPNDAVSKTSFQPIWIGTVPDQYCSLTFRRRAGSAVEYFVEHSIQCVPWNSSGATIEVTQPFVNLFEGTGTGWTTYQLNVPLQNQPSGFLRVRATPFGQAP